MLSRRKTRADASRIFSSLPRSLSRVRFSEIRAEISRFPIDRIGEVDSRDIARRQSARDNVNARENIATRYGRALSFVLPLVYFG